MRHRQIHILTLASFAAIVLMGSITLALAVIYPGFIDMITDPSLVFSVPQVPKPSYLVPMTDPTFGTKITRIANESGLSLSTATGSGTWGADARHHYSKDQPWSSDGTLIAIQNSGSPGGLILDGETYRVKYASCGNYSVGSSRWHPSPLHPHERIDVSGNKLSWVDVVTCTQIRSWTLPFTASGFGNGEGNASNDGRFVALDDGTNMYVIDMNSYPPLRIGPPTNFTACGLSSGCSKDWVSISASGQHVVVNYNGADPRVYDVDPNTLALTPHPMLVSSIRCTNGNPTQGYIYRIGHADFAINPFDNNEEVLIGKEDCNYTGKTMNGVLIGGTIMVRLKDGAITSLDTPSSARPDHISTRNYDRPGWVYVGYRPASGQPFNDEIVAIRLDGKAVQRFAHKHSAFSGCYRCESHSVPSRDGRRVIFASNWAVNCGTLCGSSSEIKDYVVDARDSGITTPLSPPKALQVR